MKDDAVKLTEVIPKGNRSLMQNDPKGIACL